MSLGDEIRKTRLQYGWSQSAPAEKVGVSRPTVARVELGEDVSTVTLTKVAEALGLRIVLSTNYDVAPPSTRDSDS